jgi:endonuclease I
MRRIRLTLLLLISFFSLYSQIPAGYYDTAEGLSGDELKTALYNIIKGHTEYPYTSNNTDVWDILKESDKDPGNPDNVILFYTGWSVNAAQEYNNGSGWNREHVWAKSRGDFGTTMGPGTDCHHLRPCDISVNSARSNRWFDECTTPYLDNGVETGCYTSSTEWIWQPRDQVKGDVARMIFYMATRYEGENGEPDLKVIDYLPADDNTDEPVHAKLDMLLKWNREDPVDDFERNRNDVVYSFQHNRNPFVDHPEYVNEIWSTATSTVLIRDDFGSVKVFPNPSAGFINIENPDKYNIGIYSICGTALSVTDDELIRIDGIKPGVYLVRIINEKANSTGTIKVVVN